MRTEPLKDWEKVLVLLGVSETNQIKSLALITGWPIERAETAFNEALRLGFINGPGHTE